MLVLSLFVPFFFSYYGDHRDLHSFPTRRSSDLRVGARAAGGRGAGSQPRFVDRGQRRPERGAQRAQRLCQGQCGSGATFRRSEEHTSELQSLTNLVCRLLLEKKKKKKKH